MTPLWLLEQAKEAPTSKYLIAVFAPPSNKPKPFTWKHKLPLFGFDGRRSSLIHFSDL